MIPEKKPSGRQASPINASESVALADAFLDVPFLDSQAKFLWSKKKKGPALMFFTLKHTRPLWAKMI